MQSASLASSGESDDGGLAPPPRKRSRSSLPSCTATTQRPAAAADTLSSQDQREEQTHQNKDDKPCSAKDMDNYWFVYFFIQADSFFQFFSTQFYHIINIQLFITFIIVQYKEVMEEQSLQETNKMALSWTLAKLRLMEILLQRLMVIRL